MARDDGGGGCRGGDGHGHEGDDDGDEKKNWMDLDHKSTVL